MESPLRVFSIVCIIVYLGLILFVQSENQMANQFRGSFNYVVKNNNVGKNYHEDLQKGLAREQQVFNTMREQLQATQFRHTNYKSPNFKNTHETKRDIPSITSKSETLGGLDGSLRRICLQKMNLSADMDMEKLGATELREIVQCMDRKYTALHEDDLQKNILPYMSWKFNFSQWSWDDPEINDPDFSKITFDDVYNLGEEGKLNWINNTKIWGRILSSKVEGPKEIRQKLLTAFSDLSIAQLAEYIGLAVTLVHKYDAKKGMSAPDEDLTRLINIDVLMKALSQWKYFNNPHLLECIRIFEEITNKNRWS